MQMLNGAPAERDGVLTDVSTDTFACIGDCSSKDDITDRCDLHCWRELKERSRAAAQAKLKHAAISRIQDKDAQEFHRISENNAVVADGPPDNHTRNESAHRGQSSEETETRQWYEKYMLEIESLPARRPSKQANIPAGTVA